MTLADPAPSSSRPRGRSRRWSGLARWGDPAQVWGTVPPRCGPARGPPYPTLCVPRPSSGTWPCCPADVAGSQAMPTAWMSHGWATTMSSLGCLGHATVSHPRMSWGNVSAASQGRSRECRCRVPGTNCLSSSERSPASPRALSPSTGAPGGVRAPGSRTRGLVSCLDSAPGRTDLRVSSAFP